MNNSLSIIIPTKDRFEHLRKCIKSILNQTVIPDEIIIVDGSTEEDLMLLIRDLFPNNLLALLKYIKSKPNLQVQRNIGIKNSKSNLLTFLDDDTVLDENYIYHVKDFFKKYIKIKKIGALSCKILDPNCGNQKERTFSVGNFISKVFMLWHNGRGKFQLSGIPTLINSNYKDILEIDYVYGGSATYPKKVLESFEFDENLPFGMMLEDDDIAYRVSRNHQNYWTPKAFLYHKSHYVNNDRYSKSKSFIINHFYLKNKNHPKKLNNRVAFYWSVFGKIVLELYISMKNKNLTGIKGTLSGLNTVIFNHSKRI
jgi:glycosyltransferase involved in cell wall biosynthesis